MAKIIKSNRCNGKVLGATIELTLHELELIHTLIGNISDGITIKKGFHRGPRDHRIACDDIYEAIGKVIPTDYCRFQKLFSIPQIKMRDEIIP